MSKPAMDKATSDRLHDQLVKLGDMMGEGAHLEPDGKWIAKEYKKVARALGYGPPRKNNTEAINTAVSERLLTTKCPKCQGALKQTRSGARRVQCSSCGGRFEFKRAKK